MVNKLYLKILKELKELPPKKTPKNIESILDKIKLYEVYPKIFAVVIKDDYLRSRVFLRYQEFYESDSENFRGKGFTWEQFVNYYKEKTKSKIFTYHEDWSGYNIPCNSIESCMAEVPDLNVYDLIMFSIVGTVRDIVGSSNYYLLGVDQSDGEDKDLIYHEIAHGLWFSDPSYKKKMKSLIRKIDPKTLEELKYILGDMGYGENVFDDEVQAYLSTGITKEMNMMDNDLTEMSEKFKKVFNTYISQITNKQVPIDWSLHF